MSVFCAEARGTVLYRRTATTGVVVRRAPSVGTIPISIIVLFFASLRVASRRFACSASCARTSWLSDHSAAAASTAVRAKSAKIAKAHEEQQHHEWCPHVFTRGVVLPVDHAAPAHQAVPGDQRARGEDAHLDREARSTA